MTGKEIFEWRRKYKLSQTKLAKEIGVSKTTLGRWERGLITPPDDIRKTLTSLLAQKEMDYERLAGKPAAAVLPELKGRNAHDNAAERNWRNEQQNARNKNDTIKQAAELAAKARMSEIKKVLEEEEKMEKMKFADVKRLMFAMYEIKDNSGVLTTTTDSDVDAVLELAEKELARRMEPGICGE